MFLCDRFNYEEHTLYKYSEIIAMPTFPTNPTIFTKPWMFSHLQYWTMLVIVNMQMTNPFNLCFIDSEGSLTANSIKDNALILFNKLYSRYMEHFALDITAEQDIRVQATHFMRKLFNKLDYTFDKYNTLLDLYKNQKEHLLDKLGRSRSGSRELSSEGEHSDTTDNISIFNDTPQTTDVIATIQQNQYASELNKGQVANSGSNSSSGTDEFSETEEWDTKTMMAKLDEIEKQFSNVWMKWLNEFDELFIEEVNY